MPNEPVPVIFAAEAVPKFDKQSSEHFQEWIRSARGLVKFRIGDQSLAEWWAECEAAGRKIEDRRGARVKQPSKLSVKAPRRAAKTQSAPW